MKCIGLYIGDIGGKNMKAAFQTLGCKVNSYDTNSLIAEFKRSGYDIVPFSEKADVYVINTCTVTGTGDFKSRQAIRRAKRNNPESVVVVTGCYAQTKPDELSKLPEVDIIAGTSERRRITGLVEKYVKRSNKSVSPGDKTVSVNDILKLKNYDEMPADINYQRTRAYLKVQDGCNSFCSYCIIPFARGPSRSRKLNDVITEAEKLAQSGFKEIVLTGIHLASYHSQDDTQTGLVELVRSVSEVNGIERVRLGSLEPDIFTEKFIIQLSKITKVCPHFHISLQSGCKETLKRMNRHYSPDDFISSVQLLREHINDVAITTDVMVGFPGETEEEFKSSYDFINMVEFSSIHVFKYSPRKGTKAASMPAQVNADEKDKRSNMMIESGKKSSLKYNSLFVGRILPVLFESRNKGFIPHYVETEIIGDSQAFIGKIMNVNIVNASENGLEGVLSIGRKNT